MQRGNLSKSLRNGHRDISPKELGTHAKKGSFALCRKQALRVAKALWGEKRVHGASRCRRTRGEAEHVEDRKAEPGGWRLATGGRQLSSCSLRVPPHTDAWVHLESEVPLSQGISRALR